MQLTQYDPGSLQKEYDEMCQSLEQPENMHLNVPERYYWLRAKLVEHAEAIR